MAKAFRLFLLGILVGVGLASFYFIDNKYLLLIGGLTLILLFGKKTMFAGIFLLACCLGSIRFSLVASPDLSQVYDQSAAIIGIVDQEPDIRINQQRLTIKVDELNCHLLITSYLYPRYSYGDILELEGGIAEPEAFSGFDYQGYLERYGIYGIMYRPKITKIGQEESIKKLLFTFKNQVIKNLDKYLVEPQGSLVKAIILASKGTVPQSIKDDFSNAGASHIIAISGMHITIISGLILNLLMTLGFNRKQAFWLATSILLVYLILIGFPASAVRATIMGFLVMWAMYLGRLNSSLNALLLTASLMLLINPLLFKNDIGFQLSFAAVIGIIYGKPLFDRLFSKLSSLLQIKEAIAMTLAAQLTTFPLTIYYFDKLSLIAPIANILVVPVLPFVLILGIMGIALSFIFPLLAQLVFAVLTLLMTYIIKVISGLSSLPFSFLEITSFSVLAICISYILVFGLLYIIRKNQDA
ncbi:ComEC family competence protein [Patescibacteria group bacterium]|nr:ComEC family competence protein [Patescibacteria group bacterium]